MIDEYEARMPPKRRLELTDEEEMKEEQSPPQQVKEEGHDITVMGEYSRKMAGDERDD